MSESSNDTTVIAGIDVGGTFTDLLLVDRDGVRVVKTPTTVENQAFGVLAALAETGTALSSIGAIVGKLARVPPRHLKRGPCGSLAFQAAQATLLRFASGSS